jgi:hypothetical protein
MCKKQMAAVNAAATVSPPRSEPASPATPNMPGIGAPPNTPLTGESGSSDSTAVTGTAAAATTTPPAGGGGGGLDDDAAAAYFVRPVLGRGASAFMKRPPNFFTASPSDAVPAVLPPSVAPATTLPPDQLVGTCHWNFKFQEIYANYFMLRGTVGELIGKFNKQAKKTAVTIIRERILPESAKTIPPFAKAGNGFGTAGGEKYVSNETLAPSLVTLTRLLTRLQHTGSCMMESSSNTQSTHSRSMVVITMQ